MDLATLRFVSDTTDLERASKVIAGLVTDVSKLDKASRDAAKTEEILAKAAKLNADAHLQNAKAQDVRLKSTITADKADQANEKSVAKKTKAIESHTQATEKNVSILQRQQDIYEYQTQGFSKGQAGILANAKATGQWSKELEAVLELQRQFSSNTFDKSETGLKRMVKASKEASAAQGFLNEGYSLTSKQARELSNDLDRQSASLKQQGKSYQEISKAQEAYKQNFVNEAVALNKSSDALAVVEKQRKDVVSATNYLTTADAKMTAALSRSNAELDKGGTDSLVKYEMALRKSGLAQDAATIKLATHKTQLTQVQATEKKRAEMNLARAASPQLTDIAVSLYSGQAPLTVLLQQGGQLSDLLKLSGVEAARFGAILKESFYSMIPVIKQVASGLSGLVTGMFMDAGKSITRFIGEITGISAVMDGAKRVVAAGGEENFKYIASLQKIGNVASAVTAAGLAAVLLVLVAMAIEYKNIIQSESELSKALATSGGALGFSKDQAVAYAEGMKSVGVGTLKAMDAITEFAKVGKIGKDGLDLIIKSALDLEKYAGVAIGETAKKFSELQDEPTKALTKFAEANGYVSTSVLDTVASLEQQGDKTAAATAATEAMRAANVSMADEAKSNLSPIAKLWDDIKSAVSSVKQEIYDLTTSNAVIGAMRTVWETVAVVVSQVWFTLKGVGKEIGGIAAQIGAVLRGDFAGAKSIGEQMKFDAASAREEQDKLVKSLLTRGETEKKNFSDSKEQNSQYAAWRKDNEKALEKQYSKSERLAQKEKQLQADVTNGVINQTKATEALAGWKRIIMGEDKKPKVDRQGIKDLETEIDILNKRAGLSSSYNNELASLQRLRSKGLITEQEYVHDVEELIKLQPFYIKQQKDINDAHELSNSLLGKQDMLGKDYYKRLEQIDKYQKMGVENGGYSVEQADKLRQAAFDQTELAKTRLKIEQDSAKLVEKYRDDIEKAQNASSLETANLDDRLALLGLTSEQQKNLRIEQERRNKLLAIDLKLQTQIQEVWDKWGNGEFGVDGATKAKAVIKELTEQAGVDMQNVNKETAVKFREDFDAELSKIKTGVTDSIVTALFEGGKAGSKKLRDVLVNVLRQKVTMVVDVGVNAFMNSMMGGFFGGGAAGAGGSGILGMASNASSLYSAVTGNGIIGNAANAVGGWLGLGGTAATGLGLSAAGSGLGLAGSAAGAGYGLTAAGTGLGLSAGSAGAGAIGAGLGSSAAAGGTAAAGAGGISGALAAIPGWGWALAGVAVLGSIFGKDDSGTYHTGGAGSYSASGGSSTGAAVLSQGLTFGARSKDYNSEAEKAAVGISKGIVEMLDSTAKSFGKDAGYYAATAFADDSSKDGAWGSLSIKLGDKVIADWASTQSSKWAPKVFSDGEAGQKEYFAAIALSAREALVTAIGDVPWATDMLTALGAAPSVEQLSQVVAQINATATALEFMRENLVGFTDYTDVSIGKLIAFAGGVDNLTKSVQSYYENFYTETERTANATRDVTEALNKMGFELPVTRDGFRTLVEQQQALGESGVETVAALLRLSSAFASITPVIDTVTQAADDLAAAEKRRADEAAQAAEDAMRKAQQIAQERMGLENKLYTLLGNTTALRARELEALDASNYALQNRIWALEDAKAAEDAARNAVNAAYSALEKSVNAEKEVINTQLKLQQEGYQAQIDAASEASDSIKSIASALSNALKATQIDTAAFNFQRFKNASSVINSAADTGNLQYAGLEDALGIAGQDSKQFYGKFEDYAFAQGVLNGNVGKLNEKAKSQLTTAEKTLQALKDQMRISSESARAQLSALDAQLLEQKNLVDAALGIDNSVLSVKAAIDGLQGAIAGLAAAQAASAIAKAQGSSAVGGGGGAGGGAMGGNGFGLTDAVDYSRTAFAQGMDITAEQLMRFGGSESDYAAWKEFNNGGRQDYANQRLNLSREDRLEMRKISTDNAAAAQGIDPRILQLRNGMSNVSADWGLIERALSANRGTTFEQLQQVLGGSSGFTTVRSVNEALAKAGIYVPGFNATGPTEADELENVRNQIAYYSSMRNASNSAEVDAIIANLSQYPGFASGGYHTGGLRIVGENGPELEATGPSRIWNAADTQRMLGGTSNDNGELIAEIRALRTEVAELKATNSAIAGHTAATHRQLVRIAPNDIVQTKEVV